MRLWVNLDDLIGPVETIKYIDSIYEKIKEKENETHSPK